MADGLFYQDTREPFISSDIVRPATPNGYVYICVVGGTSAGAPPTFSTTIGRETADGTVVWSTVGRAIVALDCDDPSWAAATITARNIRGTFLVTIPASGFGIQVRQ